jgi:hypothetical protein
MLHQQQQQQQSTSTYDIPNVVKQSNNNQQHQHMNIADNIDRLEGQSWYHAMITRIQAESFVRFDGDFLVNIV